MVRGSSGQATVTVPLAAWKRVNTRLEQIDKEYQERAQNQVEIIDRLMAENVELRGHRLVCTVLIDREMDRSGSVVLTQKELTEADPLKWGVEEDKPNATFIIRRLVDGKIPEEDEADGQDSNVHE